VRPKTLIPTTAIAPLHHRIWCYGGDMKASAIAPITELKRDATGLIERAAEQGSPIVITQNGRATAVLQDVASYEADRRAFALLKLALEGQADLDAGRRVTLADHRKRIAALLRPTSTDGAARPSKS
jgi:prevent-host-death family protein